MERLLLYVTPAENDWEVRQEEQFHGLAPFYANCTDALINADGSARHA